MSEPRPPFRVLQSLAHRELQPQDAEGRRFVRRLATAGTGVLLDDVLLIPDSSWEDVQRALENEGFECELIG